MKKEIKKVAKESGSVISEAAIMEFASHLPDPATRMALIGSFNMAKSMFGLAMETKQEKLLDWVEMIKENPSILTEEVIKDPQFQDGFVYSLEKYLKQRHKEKREIIKEIFLGYSEFEPKKEFELERMYDCIERIPLDSINLLREINETSFGYGFRHGNEEKIKYLESLGLVHIHMEREVTEPTFHDNFGETDYEIEIDKSTSLTEFGDHFVCFIT